MSAVTQLHTGGSEAVQAAFDKLRQAARKKPFATLEERLDRLDRLEGLLSKGRDSIVAAIDADFGGRSSHESLLADVVLTLGAVRDNRRHVHEWMKPKPISPSPYFRPSRTFVEYLPKGVVGIIAPWNYPVNLALAPLAGALAAGNRVLLKPSELTPRTADLLEQLVRDTFTAEEVAVVVGGPDVARAVTKLPLDHLLFTGSTTVGRLVGVAAAENLVPVTLELGGKSPTLIHPDYPIAKAAERIALGKCFNGGQTCIAPDYVLLKQGKEREFTEAFTAAVQRAYPLMGTSSQYSAIVNDRQRARLQGLLDDAKEKGARLEVIAPHGDPPAGSRKMSPVLVFGATDAMKVMQEEIFGPILPVQTFVEVDEAIDYVNAHPRPLAFYYFDDDERRVTSTLQRVVSGDACVNDTLVHFAQESLPFGGVGASGMGAYHGEEGFRTFSHARGVMVSSGLSAARRIMSPPYGAVLDAALNFMTSRIGRWFGA